MAKKIYQIILEHPDKEEIINCLDIDISPKDVHEKLAARYAEINEKHLVISVNGLKKFKDEYLDFYTIIQKDLSIVKNNDSTSLATDSPTYKKLLQQAADQELDIRTMVKNLCIAIETRLGQVFDSIQEDPSNFNPRIDRLMIEYANTLGNILEKYYKFTEAPEQTNIQYNTTIQIVDEQISVIQDTIREILNSFDMTTSLHFIELLNEKLNKLKPDSKSTTIDQGARFQEVKLLNESINAKLQDQN